MTFAKKYWNPGNRANGMFTRHEYDAAAAGDNAAAAEASGYLNGVQDHIVTGDVLLMRCTDATKHYKLTNTAGVITVSTGSAIA